jgi:hypothetical protein
MLNKNQLLKILDNEITSIAQYFEDIEHFRYSTIDNSKMESLKPYLESIHFEVEMLQELIRQIEKSK